MKCEICRKKTNWDSSVGLENFLVCNACFFQLTNKCFELSNPYCSVFQFIFACGKVREKAILVTKDILKKLEQEEK